MPPSILLAFDDVAMAIQLQESLDAAGFRTAWDAARAADPGDPSGGDAPDAVVLAGDELGERLAAAIDAWHGFDPTPGLVCVGVTRETRDRADAARIPYVYGTADVDALRAALEQAIQLRFAAGMSRGLALRALGLASTGKALDDDARIVAGARNADYAIVREALRWHAPHYVAATDRVAELRERRALQIPEVEVARKLDGTLSVQRLLKAGPLDPWQTARLLWALASIGAATMTAEPVDLETSARRALASARVHLRRRRQRLQHATVYDVLEVTPSASDDEVRRACEQLALRYAPDHLRRFDLATCAALVEPVWEQIVHARRTLLDVVQRGRYNDWLRAHWNEVETEWVVDEGPAAEAETWYARGQRALVEGDPFKAVSNMAGACRLHPGHPDYEASLAWARYRADVQSNKDRREAVRRGRAAAEDALAGRRPWPRGLLALGLLCAADGDAGAASWHVHEALAVEPNLPAARQLLTRLGRG